MRDLFFGRFDTNPEYDEIDYTKEQLLSRDRVIPSFTQRTSVNNVGILTEGARIAINVNDDITTMTESSILGSIKIYNMMKYYYKHCERCGFSMCLESMREDGTQYTLCDKCFKDLEESNSDPDGDTHDFNPLMLDLF